MVAFKSVFERAPAAALLLVAIGFFVIAGVSADIALDYHRDAEAMVAAIGDAETLPADHLGAFDGGLYQERRQCALEFASYAAGGAIAGLVFFPWRVFRGS